MRRLRGTRHTEADDGSGTGRGARGVRVSHAVADRGRRVPADPARVRGVDQPDRRAAAAPGCVRRTRQLHHDPGRRRSLLLEGDAGHPHLGPADRAPVHDHGPRHRAAAEPEAAGDAHLPHAPVHPGRPVGRGRRRPVVRAAQRRVRGRQPAAARDRHREPAVLVRGSRTGRCRPSPSSACGGSAATP